MVKIGVKLFNIPAKPEEIPVSAYVNRNAGKKLPQNPTIEKNNKSFRDCNFRTARIENGNKTLEAINMRNAPTCVDENIFPPSSVNIPFFIKIKELPQIQASVIKSNQLLVVFDIGVQLIENSELRTESEKLDPVSPLSK